MLCPVQITCRLDSRVTFAHHMRLDACNFTDSLGQCSARVTMSPLMAAFELRNEAHSIGSQLERSVVLSFCDTPSSQERAQMTK